MRRGARRPSAAALPTIYDVAHQAGVSHMTVSRVVNGSPRVSAVTRGRVLATMERLGWVPSAAARSLAGVHEHRSEIGLVVGPTSDRSAATFVTAMQRAASEVHRHLRVAFTNSPTAGAVDEALGRVEDDVCAVVLAASVSHPGPSLDRGRAVPVVGAACGGRSLLSFEQVVAASARATDYLLDQRTGKVALVQGPPTLAGGHLVGDGWRLAHERRGLPAGPEMRAGPLSESRPDLVEWLANAPGVGAVLATSDDLALSVIHDARLAGRAVPDDLRVMGFGEAPESAWYHPALTSVRLDHRGVARAAMAQAVLLAESARCTGIVHPCRQGLTPRMVLRTSA